MKIDRILDSAVLKFFPEDGDWYANCFKRSENLDMSNLPCHLRDDLWLAKMLKINQNLFYVSTERILEYIIVSPYFKEKRYEYEQKIVKWQITWMINGGGNWCVDDKYGGDFVFLSPLCDIGFRKGIVYRGTDQGSGKTAGTADQCGLRRSGGRLCRSAQGQRPVHGGSAQKYRHDVYDRFYLCFQLR